jgi:hypothetical protein
MGESILDAAMMTVDVSFGLPGRFARLKSRSMRRDDVADKFGEEKASPHVEAEPLPMSGACNTANTARSKARDPDKNLSAGWR